jgi:hypothetical protein
MTPSPNFRHIILTRFNIRSGGRETKHRNQPDWLPSRFDLYERYCLPSVAAQSSQDFIWLVYFDSGTPSEFKKRIEGHARRYPNLRVIYRGIDEIDVKQDIRSMISEPSGWLLTTRLDNDDGLHRDFVATVQSQQNFVKPEALNFPVGIIFAENKTYLHRDESNPFLSLSEPYADFATIWSVRHTDVARVFSIRQLPAEPMWLQVVHGDNVSNKVRGTRILRATALHGFEAISFEAGARFSEGALAITLENATVGVIRRARDVAIAVTKPFIRQLRP